MCGIAVISVLPVVLEALAFVIVNVVVKAVTPTSATRPRAHPGTGIKCQRPATSCIGFAST